MTLTGVKGSFLFDNPYIKPDKKKEYLRIIKHDSNFFKHAGRDASESVKFETGRTEFFLFDAVTMHHALTERWLWSGFLFFTWFSLTYPDTVLKDTPVRAIIDTMLDTPDGLARANKQEYSEFLEDEEMLRLLGDKVDFC